MNNNNNFFQKHLITISVIAFLAIVVLIGIFQKKTILKKEAPKGKLPPLGQKSDQTPSLHSSRPETEPSKLKFKTTQSHFDKIKAYVLSETDDKSLLPKNLSPEEESEIENAKEKFINSLKNMKQQNNPQINEYQQKCDNYNHEIKQIQDKFPSLEQQKTKLEQDLEAKEKAIKQKQEEEKTASKDDKTRLQAEISKLKDERLEIVRQISDVQREIVDLEADQKMYEEMLSNANLLKESLIRDRNYLSEEFKGLTISVLQSHYDITSAEG
ncbi:hypothetical protein [Hydrangea phyllody phytoplasma]|uniref:hypothetical protein n=1 Tax=Hydrangea phyllody phytoplasma TaxID=238673 RepID=UPI002D209F4A|nr:hypothetical protein HP2P_4240 [Hydrangea phyllody phytoplasma]